MSSPDAELLVAPGCAHCPGVLDALAKLVEHGDIGRLDIINIVSRPDEAEARGVRGVPWIRIGPFELQGAYTARELAEWIARVDDPDGRKRYLSEGLEAGQLHNVVSACRRHSSLLTPLIALAGDLETPFAVRVGVGAVLEDLCEHALPSDAIAALHDGLRAMTGSALSQVRADAAHFLGLVGGPVAVEQLRALAADADHAVREIAMESLQALSHARS